MTGGAGHCVRGSLNDNVHRCMHANISGASETEE